jgi:hypothetical protein
MEYRASLNPAREEEEEDQEFDYFQHEGDSPVSSRAGGKLQVEVDPKFGFFSFGRGLSMPTLEAWFPSGKWSRS